MPSLPAGTTGDLTDYLGGAAMYFDQLNPPQAIGEIEDRLKAMRLQPDYQDLPWRTFEVIGRRADRERELERRTAVQQRGDRRR